MTEDDYIVLTNLAKLRIAENIMRSVMPDGEIAEAQVREISRTIAVWIGGLEAKVEKKQR